MVKDGKYRALTQEEEVTELPAAELKAQVPAGVHLKEVAALFFAGPEAAAGQKAEPAEPAEAASAGELQAEN